MATKGRAERGQTTIEFAVVFPLMAILLFAIMEVALALHQRTVMIEAVSHAARLGARDADADIDEIKQRAVDASNNLLQTSDLDPPAGDVVTPCEVLQPVVVQASHSYPLITPLEGLLNLIGAGGPSLGITLTAEAQEPQQFERC